MGGGGSVGGGRIVTVKEPDRLCLHCVDWPGLDWIGLDLAGRMRLPGGRMIGGCRGCNCPIGNCLDCVAHNFISRAATARATVARGLQQ